MDVPIGITRSLCFLSLLLIGVTGQEGEGENLPPILTASMSGFALSEDTPVASEVYILRGYDPEEQPVTFSINSDFFEVRDEQDGRVFLLRQLDYQVLSEINVVVSISDGQQTTQSNARIIIMDTNDKLPEFTQELYTATIPETSVPGTIVIPDIRVEDADNVGSNLTVECLRNVEGSLTPCDKFSVDVISVDINNWHGRLLTSRQLSYAERSSYTLVLRASDGKNVVTKEAMIYLTQSSNQPPVFSGARTVYLEDNTAAGTLITTIVAVDGDETVQNEIRFSLIQNPGNLFNINAVTGELTAATLLTQESPFFSSGVINIIVRASEVLEDGSIGTDMQTTSQQQITVEFQDANRYAPTITPVTSEMKIKESIPVGTAFLSLTVTDIDLGSYARYSVMLTSNEETRRQFEVAPSSGDGTQVVEIRVRNDSSLDYDQGPAGQHYQLIVVARETETVEQFSSTATVDVMIDDVNDNDPVFAQNLYYASVPEDASPGTFVITITATDGDDSDGIYGDSSLRYRLSGAGSEYFRADSRTGRITVANCNGIPGEPPCLDYESFESINLKFTAGDSFGEGHLTDVNLTISIENVNDNRPVFQWKNYTSYINSSETVPVPPVVVKAEDADGDVIQYSIIAGNFGGVWQIDIYTGRITGNRPVMYEDTPGGQGVYQMTVRANDGRNSDTCTVWIYVLDRNDNPPVFFPNFTYEEWIPEDTQPGTTVVNVEANDADPSNTPNGQVYYYFDSGDGLNVFEIGQTTGVVRVQAGVTFDYDIKNLYMMRVIAADKGTPPMSATGTVIIHITDANNKKPAFDPNSVEISIYENTPMQQIVTTMSATDPDTSAVLRYSFIDPYFAFNPSGNTVAISDVNYPSWFSIDSVTGAVRVNAPLQRDLASRIFMTVQARDISGAPDQTGDASLIINILHVNDQYPEFDPPWTLENPYIDLQVEEETPTGTYVATVAANDPDNEGIDFYRIISNPGVYFNISDNSGVLYVARPMDYETMQYVEIVVIAADRGNPQLTSTATVRIEIININDNNPTFIEPFYNTTVRENSPAGTSITKVSATDRDLGDFGVVRYVLEDPYGTFTVNNITGVVTVVNPARLDREQEAMLELSVTAYDSPNNPSVRKYATVPLYVYLMDENDNNPRFVRDVWNGTVDESAPPGTEVITVSAYDPDANGTSILTYYIVGGNGGGMFRLDPNTGVISTNTPLTDRDGVYNLTIQVRDNGIPPLSGNGSAIITVIPANNGPPVWKIPSNDTQSVGVPENQPPGRFVTTVLAVDEDPNSNVTYYFLYNGQPSQQTGEFEIHAGTGVITTRVTFDRESRDTYQVILVARDSGIPVMSSQRYFTIFIEDIGDNDPEFPQYQNCCTIPYTYNISENLPPSQYVGQVEATDKDIGPDAVIQYFIVGGNGDEAFRIENTTGRIYTNRSLDHESRAQYELSVRAVNVRAGTTTEVANPDCRCFDKSLVTVVINVIDMNDSPPTFAQDMYIACISVEAPFATTVTTIQALDEDSVANANLQYSIRSITSTAIDEENQLAAKDGMFKIFQNNGTIFSNSLMTGYEQHYFSLAIRAADMGGLWGDTDARIWVTEPAQEMTLTITKPPEEVRHMLPDITAWVQQVIPGSAVCFNDIRYHLNGEYTVITDWTDILIHVVRVDTGIIYDPDNAIELLWPPQTDDGAAWTGALAVTDLKPTYVFWDGFDQYPVLVAIIIIILLLLAALFLLCCLMCLLAACCPTDEKKKKYIQPFMVPMGTREKLYEDQELNMALDQVDEIKLTGTVNEGFVGDEIDNRAETSLTSAANGTALIGVGAGTGGITTTTQNEYQMNYEHNQMRQEMYIDSGGETVSTLAPGTTPMIIAGLEPRDSDSGIRSASVLGVHRPSSSVGTQVEHHRSMPMIATGNLSLAEPYHSAAIGATLHSSQTDLSQHSFSVRSDGYSLSPTYYNTVGGESYVPTWPRAYQSQPLEVVGGATRVPVVNDDAFFPDGMYQGEILLGTYQPPHTPISPYQSPPSPFIQQSGAYNPPTYDSVRYESRSYEHSQHYDSVHPDENYY